MRERRSHSAQNENESQAPQSPLHGPAIVENILSHGESQPDHARVYYSINDAVELILLPHKQHDQNERLDSFFHERIRAHLAKILANLVPVRLDLRHYAYARIKNASHKHLHHRS